MFCRFPSNLLLALLPAAMNGVTWALVILSGLHPPQTAVSFASNPFSAADQTVVKNMVPAPLRSIASFPSSVTWTQITWRATPLPASSAFPDLIFDDNLIDFLQSYVDGSGDTYVDIYSDANGGAMVSGTCTLKAGSTSRIETRTQTAEDAFDSTGAWSDPSLPQNAAYLAKATDFSSESFSSMDLAADQVAKGGVTF